MLDCILTLNNSLLPSKTVEGRVHLQSGLSTGTQWGTGPLDSIFPSHFLCMCLSHYFIFSLSEHSLGNKMQTGTWCWQQVTDTPKSSAVYLSAVNTGSVRVNFSHLLPTTVLLKLRLAYYFKQFFQHINEHVSIYDTATKTVNILQLKRSKRKLLLYPVMMYCIRLYPQSMG